jgi:hypothetical protein
MKGWDGLMGGYGSGRPGVLRGPYKGGQSRIGNKIEIFLPPSHRFRSMAKSNGYVYRSRFVMAETIGRPLTDNETVHHINEIEDDDRPENLRLYDVPGKHSSDHRKKRPHLPNHIASKRKEEKTLTTRDCVCKDTR